MNVVKGGRVPMQRHVCSIAQIGNERMGVRKKNGVDPLEYITSRFCTLPGSLNFGLDL